MSQTSATTSSGPTRSPCLLALLGQWKRNPFLCLKQSLSLCFRSCPTFSQFKYVSNPSVSLAFSLLTSSHPQAAIFHLKVYCLDEIYTSTSHNALLVPHYEEWLSLTKELKIHTSPLIPYHLRDDQFVQTMPPLRSLISLSLPHCWILFRTLES